MKCAKVKNLISEYVDGLVSPRVREELSEHFAVCKTCNGELETTTRMLAAVSELRVGKAPVDLWPGVQARVKAQPVPGTGILRRIMTPIARPIIALPVTATVAAALVMTVHTMHKPMEPKQYASANTADMAAYVEEYSQFRSKQSFGDTSGLVVSQLERPGARGH